jgi:ferrous iron transport protein A
VNKIYLTQLRAGEEAKIVDLQGGIGFRRRVENLGIREGMKIKKISSQLFRGPVTIQVGNTKVAIGYGMAKKIIVERE